jgi:phosphoribosylaminoimidazolecarboxamide formyltransferase/IMP cyclohydrolase
MPTALLSVWDKRGIVEFAQRLVPLGFDLLSTGGTAQALRAAGLPVTDVNSVTGFPEMLEGRVKTLHPAIHGGLLARRHLPEHLSTLADHGIRPIDVLVSNLYPFGDVVSQPDATDERIIENIDVGGPAMVRAAAKNHTDVVVLTNPDDYEPVAAAIERGGLQGVDHETRRALAARAFEHVACYDALVATYLRTGHDFPVQLPLGAKKLHDTRYGENPHQRAAVYALPQPGLPSGVATWHVHAGRELSYNNYLDASAAWQCAASFDTQAVVIVKHTLPCGVGLSDDQVVAYERALSGDPVSAFGGIMACNRVVTEAVAVAIGRQRFDVMIAPGYQEGALERLLRKRNLRLISVANPAPAGGWDYRSIPGGLLVQEQDTAPIDSRTWRCVTRRQPSSDQLATLALAWRTVRYVKSNAIVLAQPDVVVGVGAGQPNRVESVRLAVKVAGERAAGSCLASDAFFPFADGVEAAIAAGVVAIAQPGGSVRDEESIAAADAHDVVMVFTDMRNFRH